MPILHSLLTLGRAPIIIPIASPIIHPKNNVAMIAGYLFPKSTPSAVIYKSEINSTIKWIISNIIYSDIISIVLFVDVRHLRMPSGLVFASIQQVDETDENAENRQLIANIA